MNPLIGVGDAGMQTYAVIDRTQKFRYLLGRRWSPENKMITYVMFNPSTADAHTDDATIRKCIGFAKRLGFDRLEVVNLFAYRTREPNILRAHGYQGADDKADEYLQQAFMNCASTGGQVVCAWGSNARDPIARERVTQVRRMIKAAGLTPKALRILDDGTPSHPLMLSYERQLVDYT